MFSLQLIYEDFQRKLIEMQQKILRLLRFHKNNVITQHTRSLLI